MKSYRTGVIGLGWMGWLYDVADRRGAPECGLPTMRKTPLMGLPNSHAGAYRFHVKTRLVAGCDPDVERLKGFGKHYGVKALYKDYWDMLEKESLDLVSVCTKTDIRPEVTSAAVKAGVKGVFTEKPMAHSLEEADRMVDVCRKANVKLLVGSISVCHPAFGKARKMIEQEEVGELVSMVTGMQTAQHNTFLYLVGSEVDWVLGNMESPEKAQEDFDSEVTPKSGFMYFKNRVEGAILGLHRPCLDVTLTGTKGFLTFNWSKGFRLWKELDTTGLAELPWPIADQFSVPYTYYGVADLIQCIEEDAEPRVSGRRVRHAMEIEVALRESYRRGQVKVTLPISDRKLRLLYRSFR